MAGKAIRFVVEIPVSRVQRDANGRVIKDHPALEEALTRGFDQMVQVLCQAKDLELEGFRGCTVYHEYIDGFGNAVR